MFEYIERNHLRILVFIPGWAFDCKIFAGLDLPEIVRVNEVGKCDEGGVIARTAQERHHARAGELAGGRAGLLAACLFTLSPTLLAHVAVVGP